MNVSDLNAIFKACKNFISKDAIIPIFQHIKLECENGICKASAADGVKLINIVVPCVSDDGSLIVPIIKTPKGTKVIISDDEKEITFDFLTEKQIVRKVDGEFPDTNRFMYEDEPNLKIGFDPKVLKVAMDGFSDEVAVQINIFDANKGFIVKSANKEALILPVRLNNYI